jgi:hypothetical protein
MVLDVPCYRRPDKDKLHSTLYKIAIQNSGSKLRKCLLRNSQDILQIVLNKDSQGVPCDTLDVASLHKMRHGS